jgi:hypothetical protein
MLGYSEFKRRGEGFPGYKRCRDRWYMKVLTTTPQRLIRKCANKMKFY